MSISSEQPSDTLSHLNAKQKSRIQKRRLARQKLQEVLALSRKDTDMYAQSPPYPNAPHLSAGCTQHAQDSYGRFLTPEQITVQEIERLVISNADVKPGKETKLAIETSEQPKL
jgi:hypothetical protein